MKRIAIVLVIFALAMTTGCKEQPKGLGSGAQAPDFVLNDISGKAVRLSDYKGKVVVLEFWATWCPPCVMAIPELNELQEKYMDEDFVLLAISIDDDLDALKAFHEEYTMNYPVLFDDKGVSNTFGIYTVPTTVIVGKDGKIQTRHLGYAPDVLAELVQEALDSASTTPQAN